MKLLRWLWLRYFRCYTGKQLEQRCRSVREGLPCTRVRHDLFEGEPVHAHTRGGRDQLVWVDHDTPHWIS